jgi:hypothetical protein
MSETRTSLQRWKTGLGLFCLVLTFLLWSPGVRTVRAGDVAPQTSPGSAEQEPAAAVVEPARSDGQIEMAPRVSDPRAEAVGGVVVLNTRGYNYGPDRPTVRPRAVQQPAASEAEPKK